MSKTRTSWLAAGLAMLLISGAPGFVAPCLMHTAEAQSQKITGTVVDEFGDPVIGANVRVKGTTIGAVSLVTPLSGQTSASKVLPLVPSLTSTASSHWILPLDLNLRSASSVTYLSQSRPLQA